MSDPLYTPREIARSSQRCTVIAIEIRNEADRQGELWGVDRALPDGLMVWHRFGADLEGNARGEMGFRGDSWASILLEEVGEALQAGNAGALRGELVQVAACCMTWIDALDRRATS